MSLKIVLNRFVIAFSLISSLLILEPVLAQGNTIEAMVVTVPACSGYNGRVNVTYIHDSNDALNQPRWVSVDSVSVSVSGDPPGISTTKSFQFIPAGNTQPGDLIPVRASMGTAPFTDNLASMTVYFSCSTGNELTLPIAVEDNITTTQNIAVSFNVLANDIDPDGVLNPDTTTNLSLPANGTLVNNGNGNFIYTPNNGYVGSDAFDYQVCAGPDTCDAASVMITVEAAVVDNEPDNNPGNVDVPLAPPACEQAQPSVATLWPPNHQFVPVKILGLDETNSTSVEITALISNELETAPGSGNTGPDVGGLGTDTALLRAERAGNGGGRTYIIQFVATNALGSCEGGVQVNVPHDMGGNADAGSNNNNGQASDNSNQSNGNRNGNANGNRNGNGNGNGNRNGNANGRGRN